MTDFEFTAKTVEEAVEEGLKATGLTREQAEITVLEEGEKKTDRFRQSKGTHPQEKVGRGKSGRLSRRGLRYFEDRGDERTCRRR